MIQMPMPEMRTMPAAAYPRASYREEQRVTPDRVAAASTQDAHLLYIGGQIIGTSRLADDTELRAAIELAHTISQAAERHGAAMRAELELRELSRASQGAVSHSAQGSHPYARPGSAAGPTEDATETAVVDGPGQTLALPQISEDDDAAE